MGRDDPRDENGGEELEAEIMRADHAFGVVLDGTTAEEELKVLTMDDALARERPEAPVIDAVIALEEDAALGVAAGVVAEGSFETDEFASAEESALSIRDRVPGATTTEIPMPIADGSARQC